MQEISTHEDWETLTQAGTPFFVFKHSTTCPVSASARNRVKIYLAQRDMDSPPFAMVKVIEARPLSNAIAKALGVIHQSPQLILVNNGQAQWDGSHHWISEGAIAEAVEALG